MFEQKYGANGQRENRTLDQQVETIEEYLFTRREIAEGQTGGIVWGKYWIVIEW